MKRFRILLAAVALASLTAFALVMPGCTRQGSRRVTDPGSRPDAGLAEFSNARWITAPDEVREETARAARSPLVARAVLEQASDPRLALLRSGVMGAAGVAKDGSQVRITLLPYQYSDNQNRAVYLALIEVNGVPHVDSFELIRNGRPGPNETDFERVNSGEHGLWIRGGPTYTQASTGVVRRGPERFNFAKFGACFIPLADRLLGEVHEGCHSMGDFPGCVSIGSSAAILGAALYCAYASWNG